MLHPPPQDKSSTGRNRCCLYPICPQSSGLSASVADLRASLTAVPSVRLGAARGRSGTKSLCNQRVRLGGDGGSAGMQTFTIGPSRPCKQRRWYKRGRLNNWWDVRGSGFEGYLGASIPAVWEWDDGAFCANLYQCRFHSVLLHPVWLMEDFSPSVLHSFPASVYLPSILLTKLLCQSVKV